LKEPQAKAKSPCFSAPAATQSSSLHCNNSSTFRVSLGFCVQGGLGLAQPICCKAHLLARNKLGSVCLRLFSVTSPASFVFEKLLKYVC